MNPTPQASIFGSLAEAIGRFVLVALIDALNAVILAIGTLIGGLLSLLPNLPAAPTAPVAQWVGWINWLFPVGPMVAALSVFVGLWTAMLIIRIPLKWVKGL